MRSAAKGNRQLNTRRQKCSNAGFSLVELLIAVTILAIIVIPLLHMFVTSTRINVKSRQMLRATTVAQDIMEGLKAYNLEEVRAQFAPPEGASPSTYYYPSNGFYVLSTNLIQGGVREITELEVDGEEIYYFGIENLKMQGGEYDAFIKLDASTYGANSKEGAGVGGTPAPGAHDKEFNGAFYAEMASVSETSGGSAETDSSFHENKDLNKAVLTDVKRQIENSTPPEDLPENWDEVKLVIYGDAGTADNIAIVSREIHVLLDQAKDDHGNAKKDAEGNLQCRATITFTYDCLYNGESYTSHGYDGVVGGKVEDITRTFTSGNFYLFYYPLYKTGGQIDTILFEVKDASILFDEDEPLLKSITLAKQIRSNVDSDAQVIAPEMSNNDLWQAEINYIMEVDVKILDGTMKNDLVFRDNLGMNLAKNPDPTGDREITNGNAKHKENMALNPNIIMTDMTGGNVSSKITNVIYDIEITVYETGAAQHFTEANFETTYGNDVHKLASITNLD